MQQRPGIYSSICLLIAGLLFLASATVEAQATVAIPFESSGNLIILKTSVNGSRPLSFILDTGASGTVIAEAQAKNLKLALETEGTASTQGGDIGAAYVKNASVRLAPRIELKKITLAAIDLRGLESGLGRAVDGILGYEIFNHYVVEIDYASRFIRLHEPKNFTYTGRGRQLKIAIDDNTPFAEARIAFSDGYSADGNFLINTGSTGSVHLNGPFAARKGLVDHAKNARAITFGALLAGRSSGRIGRLARLELGEFELRGPIANFSQDVEGDDSDAKAAGMIGSEVLRRFKLTIDYGRGRMFLEPNRHISEPFEFDMSGASLAAGGPNFRTYKVRSLIEGSPASESGLKVGDIIESINRRKTRLITLEEIRRMFRQTGRTYSLRVKRDGKPVEVTFTTRRIV